MTSPFPICIHLYVLSHLVLCKLYCVGVEGYIFVLFLILVEMVWVFLWCWLTCFSYIALIMLIHISSIPSLFGDFIIKECCLFKKSLYWMHCNNHVNSFLQSLYVVYLLVCISLTYLCILGMKPVMMNLCEVFLKFSLQIF